MYYDFTVPIPDVRGKIIRKKKGDSVYLQYEYDRVYDAELEKIEMVRRNNGTYRLDHAVTKRQKTILSAFGLDNAYVRLKATEIGSLVSNGMSMMDAANEEEGEEEYGREENECFH